MASPEIAGMVALAQQLALQELGRRLSFDEIRSLFKSTGDAIVDGDNENDIVPNTGLTFYRADMLALAEAILNLKPPSSYSVTVTAGSTVVDTDFGFAATTAVQALAGDDVVFGTAYGEELRGGAGDDQINGGSGDDNLYGEGGDDNLNGGEGLDQAIFSRNKADYSLQFTAVGYTVKDNVGADGIDTLLNIEQIVFSDVTLAVDTTAPIATTFSPADEATAVAIGANIVLTFSEAVQRGVGSIVLKTAAGVVVATYDAATSTNLSISGSTLTINPTADLGYSTAYKVELAAGSIKDIAGNSYAGLSDFNFTTASRPNYRPTGIVTISGTATQGQTLTATNSLADLDGLGEITYQWSAAGTAISGATSSTYVLTETEVGKTVTVAASYTDVHGTTESVSSSATEAVVNTNDSPTGSVTITGTATQGQTLTASNTLADQDGLGTVSYIWSASGVAITGAASSTYVLTQSEAGKAITVAASYTDGQGTLERVTSAEVLVSAGKTVDIQAYSWKAHTLLDGVAVGLGSASQSTGSLGSTSFAAITDTAITLSATRSIPSTEATTTSAAVNLQDAIAILKMIVGLDVNGTGKALSPYQALAADYDGNGQVQLSDAIGVLKHVVGLTAPDPTWYFVNEIDSTVLLKANLAPGVAQTSIAATLSGTSPVHVGLVGYLSGDVDGSFAGASGASALTTSYFTALINAHTELGSSFNLAQFGVYTSS